MSDSGEGVADQGPKSSFNIEESKTRELAELARAKDKTTAGETGHNGPLSSHC